jgi:O-antigen ligase
VLRTPLDVAHVAIYALLFVAVALLVRRRPAVGIAALIAVVPFDLASDAGPTTITLAKAALAGAAAGLILRRPRLRALVDPATTTAKLFGAGLLVAAATALTIPHAEFRGPALRETLKALEYAALFAVVALAAREDPDDAPPRYAFVGSTILISVLALAEEAGGAPSGLWFANHAIPRIAGPLEGPNQLAGYLGIALAAVTAYLVAERRAPLERVALALGAAAVVLTVSRAGLLGAVTAVGIAAAVSPGRFGRRTLALATAGGATFGLLLLAGWGYAATHSIAGFDLLSRFSTLAEAARPGAVGDRSQLWHAALVLWRSAPVFGIGAGNFELELGRAGYPTLHTHANSLYLQALAEGGLVLLTCTVLLVVLSIERFRRGPFREPLVVAALAASVGFAAHQLFDLLVFYPKVGELWWILLGLGAARVDAAREAA